MIELHEHNGIDLPRIQPSNISGIIRTVTDIPTYVPKNFIDQMVLYIGSEVLLYVYDFENATWRRFNYVSP